MNTAISITSIQQLFTAARTHHAWQDRDIGMDCSMRFTTWPSGDRRAPTRCPCASSSSNQTLRKRS
jgi:hypothetical protein